MPVDHRVTMRLEDLGFLDCWTLLDNTRIVRPTELGEAYVRGDRIANTRQ